MDPKEAGLYAYSLLVLVGAYVIILSSFEGIKKKYSWRWAIIIMMASYTFYVFGSKTNTFNFMWSKIDGLISSASDSP